MTFKIVENFIAIPQEVKINLEGKTITVEGEKGKLERDFTHSRVDMALEEDKLRLWTANPRKKEASLVNTISTHIKNMVKGVTQGFVYKLKIVFVHFPTTVRVEPRKVVIQNFFGERKPREANIEHDTSVSIRGDDIIVEGLDIEKVAQTAANIQRATRIRNKDRRKFLDGIYIYSKE